MHICIAVAIYFSISFTYSIGAYYDDCDHLNDHEEENDNGYLIINNNNNNNIRKFDSIINNNKQKFGCTKCPNLSCLIYGNVGCYLLCNIEAILYGCTSYEAVCRKGIYCECNEVFELPSNNLVTYDHFSDMSLETLWYYRFTENAASSALLNKIINQWRIEDEIKEILSYPHLSGQEIKNLFMEQLPSDNDVQRLQIQIHGQKDKILSSGKKFEYDKLGVYYIDLFTKAAQKAGSGKFNKRMKKLLNSIDNKEELRYVMHEVNNTTNERLKKAIKSFLVKKGLSPDDDDDDVTRYSNGRKKSLEKAISRKRKMGNKNKADGRVPWEEESDMGYDPPTYKKVTLNSEGQPKTIYDDEDHIIEVSVINNMMQMFDKERKKRNNEKCIEQEISNVGNINLNNQDFEFTTQIQLEDGKKDIFRSTQFTDNTPNNNLKTSVEHQFQEINNNADIQYNTNYYDSENYENDAKYQEYQESGNLKLFNIINGDTNDDNEEGRKIMDRKSLQSIDSDHIYIQDQELTNEMLLVDKFEGPIIDDPDLSCFLFGNTGCHYLCNIHSLLYGCEYESECVNQVYCMCGEMYKLSNNEEITYAEFTELSLDELWNYRFKKTKPSRRILKNIKNDANLAAEVRDILSYPHLSGYEIKHLLSDLLDHDHDIDDLKVNIRGQKDNILVEEDQLKYDNLASHFPELYKEIKQDVSKMKYIERMKKLLGKIKEKDVLETIMQAIHDTGNDALLRPIVRSFLEKAETNSASGKRPSRKKNQYIGKTKSVKDGNTKSPTFKEVIMTNGKEEITIENDEDFIIEVGLINDMIKFVDERNAKQNKQSSGKSKKKNTKRKKREKSAESDEQNDDESHSSDGENYKKKKRSKKQKKKCDSSKESEQQCEENISSEEGEEEYLKKVKQINKNDESKLQKKSKSLYSYPPIAKGYLQKKLEYTGSYEVIYKCPLNSDENINFEYHYSYTGSYNWEYSDGRNIEKYSYCYNGSDEYSCDCYPDFVKPKLITDFLFNPHPY